MGKSWVYVTHQSCPDYNEDHTTCKIHFMYSFGNYLTEPVTMDALEKRLIKDSIVAETVGKCQSQVETVDNCQSSNAVKLKFDRYARLHMVMA